MLERDICKHSARQSNDVNLWAKYRVLRNNVTSECHRAKREYHDNLISENRNNSKKLWQTIKKLLPSKVSSHISHLLDGNITCNNPLGIAEGFNKFF